MQITRAQFVCSSEKVTQVPRDAMRDIAFIGRSNVGCERMHYLFVLVDSRLEPQKIDLRFIEMLGQNGVPFGIIFTKCDKLSAAQTSRNVEAYRRELSQQWEELPPMFLSSSATGAGRDQILQYIEDCL